MKKFMFFGLSLIALGIVILSTNCDIGINVNLEVATKHTSWIYTVSDSTLGSVSFGNVYLEWTWLAKVPTGDSVVIERSVGNKNNYQFAGSVAPLDTVMSFTDKDSSAIQPQKTIYYKLSLAKGSDVTTVTTFTVKTLPGIEITSPGFVTSFDNDSIDVVFNTIEEEQGKLITSYKVRIFKASYPDTVSAVIDTTLNVASDAKEVRLKIGRGDKISENSVYTVTVTASRLIELITDTSIGNLTFFLMEGSK